MGECYLLFVGVEVKIVNEFESSMKIVKVPLEFLQVEFGGLWNERQAPLQKFLLG